MCKIIKFFFILFLFFPMYVFGATGLFWYEVEPVQYYAYISNEKGATAMCYDIYNDFLCGEVNVPYLNKIDVSDEVFIDGKLYVEFSYNNKLYYLDINDIDVANGNNETFQYRPTNTILTYKDIYLFEGPSYAYNKISKIPAGTKLEFNYANTLWAYTEYEGKKGWVNFYSYPTSTLPDEHSGCLENVNLEYHLYNDLKLSSSPFSNDEIVGVIPKNRDIKFKYSYYSINGVSFYIEYDGKKGWVNKVYEYNGRTAEIYDEDGFEVLASKGGSIFSLREFNVYSDVYQTNIVGMLDKYNDVDLNYFILNKNDDKLYLNIKFDDIDGWIIDEDYNEENENDVYRNFSYAHFSSDYYHYRLNKDLELYNINSGMNETISKGEVIVGNNSERFDFYEIYYHGNKYRYTDFDGVYCVKNGDDCIVNNYDYSGDNEDVVQFKEFIFDVDVPIEVLNSNFFSDEDETSDEIISTPFDDIVQTLSDDDIGENDKYVFNMYIIIFPIVVLIFIIICIKRKNNDSNILGDNNNNNSQL